MVTQEQTQRYLEKIYKKVLITAHVALMRSLSESQQSEVLKTARMLRCSEVTALGYVFNPIVRTVVVAVLRSMVEIDGAAKAVWTREPLRQRAMAQKLYQDQVAHSAKHAKIILWAMLTVLFADSLFARPGTVNKDGKCFGITRKSRKIIVTPCRAEFELR